MVARNKYKEENTLRTYERNPYGMPRQQSSREDDHQAFVAIQVERYLKRKRVQRFCSEAEKDAIFQIIGEYWEKISRSRKVGHMDTDCKIKTFYHITLVFPYFVAEEESLLCVDFVNKTKITSEDACPCGSGKSFRDCCGSIKTVQELINGSF
ncbi:hypothetical protein EXM22_04530 [Oceanispirochaeta crateris]|uniref:SEC-C domain-containing protein n=1 Tax=Oceanispirochaeta crateris TaxID=2518645 RepID=A0A5C1QJE5_9SPIO|nr:SEC-C metal-binding domain-containing protein [Oceanispirochaeta crateris]QEN07289.1 hypothetical protein EXM22_04530 [Oceanispirochaeta crateris]